MRTIALSTLVFLTLWTGVRASAVTAYEAPLGGWQHDSFGLSLSTEYFMSKANYSDTRGSYERLLGDSSFTSWESHLRGRYNLNEAFSFYAAQGFTNSHAVDALNDKTNSTLTDLSLGADFLLNKKYVHLIPELQIGFPLNSAPANQTSPLTSDAVFFTRIGMFFYKPFRHFRLGGYTGLHVNTDNLPSKFLYEATIDVRLFRIVTIGGGIDGYETVIGDRVTYQERYQYNLKTDAGSQRFRSFDPALLEGRAWIGFWPEKTLWVRVGYAKTLNGMHTAEGQSLLLSLAYNSQSLSGGSREATPVPSGPAAPVKRPNSDEALRGFQPEIEQTEQGIFEEEAKEVLPIDNKADLDKTEKMLEKRTNQPQK